MTEYVQWGSVPEDSNGGDSNLYLKMKTGGTYKIRPVLDPVKFFKYFQENRPFFKRTFGKIPSV